MCITFVFMNCRTFLESEVKNPVLRKDLYEKMVAIDPNAPTETENADQSITKLRYMQVNINNSLKDSTPCIWDLSSPKQFQSICVNHISRAKRTINQIYQAKSSQSYLTSPFFYVISVCSF